MTSKHVIAVITFMVCGAPAWAQKGGAGKDTTIRTNTIEVIQSYKPEVKQTPKPEFVPAPPPPDTSRPAYRYVVPEQTLYFTYHSQPLKPLALGKDTLAYTYPNYLKLGGGNLATIYFDAGIGGIKGENYSSAIHVHHLSQTGSIANQKSSLSGIEADGTLHTDRHAWHAGIDALRNQYGFYGYDHAIYEYGKDTVNQTFLGLRFKMGMMNEAGSLNGFNYHPRAEAGIYSDHWNNKETSFGFDVPFEKQLDSSLNFSIGLRGNFASLKTDVGNASMFQLLLTPAATYHREHFEGKVGIYPALANDDQVFLLPDIAVRIKLNDNGFSFGGGWQAKLVQNTFESLSRTNQWFLPDSNYLKAYRQTKTDEVFVTAQSNIGNNLNVSGRLSWWQYLNLPVFINNFGDQKVFSIMERSLVNAISFQASARYQIGNTFAAGVSGTWINFSNEENRKVYHIPGVNIKADLLFKPLPKLTVTAYTAILDRIYAPDMMNMEIKLKPIGDVGVGGIYELVPRLSAFLQINNLFNSHYERWMGYQTYGFNIYGGLRLKF